MAYFVYFIIIFFINNIISLLAFLLFYNRRKGIVINVQFIAKHIQNWVIQKYILLLKKR